MKKSANLKKADNSDRRRAHLKFPSLSPLAGHHQPFYGSQNLVSSFLNPSPILQLPCPKPSKSPLPQDKPTLLPWHPLFC